MADERLRALVQKMIDDGQSPEFIQATLAKAKAQQEAPTPDSLASLPGRGTGGALVAAGGGLPMALRGAGRVVSFTGRHLPKIAGPAGAGLGGSIGGFFGASAGSVAAANAARGISPAIQKGGQILTRIGQQAPPFGSPVAQSVVEKLRAADPGMLRRLGSGAPGVGARLTATEAFMPASEAAAKVAPMTPLGPFGSKVARAGTKALGALAPLLENLGLGITAIDAIRNWDKYQQERAQWEAEANASAEQVRKLGL